MGGCSAHCLLIPTKMKIENHTQRFIIINELTFVRSHDAVDTHCRHMMHLSNVARYCIDYFDYELSNINLQIGDLDVTAKSFPGRRAEVATDRPLVLSEQTGRTKIKIRALRSRFKESAII